jgi:hypothetical protein
MDGLSFWLGLIGTLLGAASLVIHWLTYRHRKREASPSIRVENNLILADTYFTIYAFDKDRQKYFPSDHVEEKDEIFHIRAVCDGKRPVILNCASIFIKGQENKIPRFECFTSKNRFPHKLTEGEDCSTYLLLKTYRSWLKEKHELEGQYNVYAIYESKVGVQYKSNTIKIDI